jgi:hypothetical protein
VGHSQSPVKAQRLKSRPDPKVVFLHAEAFDRAYQRLLEAYQDNQTFANATPIGTLGAFTLELYLKCLLVLQNGEVEREHDLRKLFDELTPATQQRLRDLTRPHLAAAEKYFADAISDGSPIPKVDFDLLLDWSRRAFEYARYVYEGLPPQSGWMAGGIVYAARAAILELHPEWEGQAISMPVHVQRDSTP